MSQSQTYPSNQARARADQAKAIARFEALADAALGKQHHAPGGCRQDQSTVSMRPAPDRQFPGFGPGAFGPASADPEVERLRRRRIRSAWEQERAGNR